MSNQNRLYQRILVPLDGTDVDNAILQHVKKLARACGSRVFLLRVGQTHPWDAIVHEAEQMEAYLAARKAELEGAGITARALFLQGDAAEVILQQAEELACDLIAMSTHGHGTIKDILFGSVAHKVRHAAKVPVLLIRAWGEGGD